MHSNLQIKTKDPIATLNAHEFTIKIDWEISSDAGLVLDGVAYTDDHEFYLFKLSESDKAKLEEILPGLSDNVLEAIHDNEGVQACYSAAYDMRIEQILCNFSHFYIFEDILIAHEKPSDRTDYKAVSFKEAVVIARAETHYVIDDEGEVIDPFLS